MQQRLKENQELAGKNTKLRTYLLKGMVECADCGGRYNGVTIKRKGKEYSYYICSVRLKRRPTGEPCQSKTLRADNLEKAVFDMLVEFLNSPEVFGNEMQRRQGISAESEASLIRELESIRGQQKAEQEAEAKAFRLAARGNVSEAVFDQEVGLIRTRQRWLAEQRERLEGHLADIQRYSFDPKSIEILPRRLEAKLETATPDDRRFILEAVGTKVIVQADGTWELELQVPREVQAQEGGLQIVNTRPALASDGNQRR